MTLSQGQKHPTRVERHCLLQVWQGGAIASRIGEQQDDMIESTVAHLQRQLSLDRLTVGQYGLGFDRQLPPAAADERVPRTGVARNRQWHFRPPREPGVELTPETAEQAGMPRVSKRVATRVRPHDDLKTDDRGHARHCLERRPTDSTGFDALDLRLRQSTVLGYGPETEPGTSSGGPQFPAQPDAGRASSAPGSVERTFPASHLAPAWQPALYRRLRAHVPLSEPLVDGERPRAASDDIRPVGRAIRGRRFGSADAWIAERDTTGRRRRP